MLSSRSEALTSSGRPAGPPPAPRSLSRPYQGNPTFDPEFVRSKSAAAAGLCSWCINIVRFYEVYCDVAPKRQALEEANAELAEAQEKLSRIKNKIAVSASSTPVAAVARSVARGGGGGRGGRTRRRTEDTAAPRGHAAPQAGPTFCSSFQELNANLSNLTSAFEKATAEKIKCQQEADATNRVISLANR